jgi:NADH-quinone oxidoreductase subunit L
MMVVVTFVSLMVHVYTIGYMAEDPGYQRFFAYISLFTFSMLMLVMSNNFLQLFFGWEAVGVVSYFLIGFWYTRPSAIFANLKAFLVNRVGDFGFVLGIALVLGAFRHARLRGGVRPGAGLCREDGRDRPGRAVAAAQRDLHLPLHRRDGQERAVPAARLAADSMEGPTPISALIHAATMVTAGIFMVARMSPLFEHSETALSVVLVIGAITALFMGLIALTQYDIKRVVAYSTLSQLGYMTVALGASAYAAGIFHLMTHAFFKAVLFLAAGLGDHRAAPRAGHAPHGRLKKYMPWTYWTLLIGRDRSGRHPAARRLLLQGRDHRGGAPFADAGRDVRVPVRAVVRVRDRRVHVPLVFMAFHGEPRFDVAHPPHESPKVVTVPLVLLAIPSIASGWWIGSVVFGDYFGSSIVVNPAHANIATMKEEYHGLWGYLVHGLTAVPFWLALAGIATAWYLYRVRTDLPKKIAMRFGPLYALVERKYGFDELYQWLFAGGARKIGEGFWKGGDQRTIDGLLVNGSARLVGWFSSVVSLFQSGLIYKYAVLMLSGILLGMTWFLFLAPKG